MTPKQKNPESPTHRQTEAILAIRALQSRDGLSPSLEEIGAFLHITRASAFRLVKELEKKGFITKQPGRYRSLRLTAAASAINPLRAKKPAKK
jgi:DNA-binding MarR family transcriptional regulator